MKIITPKQGDIIVLTELGYNFLNASYTLYNINFLIKYPIYKNQHFLFIKNRKKSSGHITDILDDKKIYSIKFATSKPFEFLVIPIFKQKKYFMNFGFEISITEIIEFYNKTLKNGF